jgi:hypothetical protein
MPFTSPLQSQTIECEHKHSSSWSTFPLGVVICQLANGICKIKEILEASSCDKAEQARAHILSDKMSSVMAQIKIVLYQVTVQLESSLFALTKLADEDPPGF